MSHRNTSGISPRFAVTLELSDTCLCAGLIGKNGVIRSKGVNKAGKGFHNISFVAHGEKHGNIEVYSPYKILVNWIQDGRKQIEQFSGPQQVKLFMIGKFL